MAAYTILGTPEIDPLPLTRTHTHTLPLGREQTVLHNTIFLCTNCFIFQPVYFSLNLGCIC